MSSGEMFFDKNENVIKSRQKSSGISDITYSYTSHVRDKRSNKREKRNVYSVQFNYFLAPTETIVFASVGGHRLFVYECKADGAMQLLQCYDDPDKKEVFYTICWSRMESFEIFKSISSILVAAGKRGIIRMIDTTQMECVYSFSGHTAAVNDVKIHPKDTCLLLSASKDHSIRLWCMTTRVCVAIFGGHEGHRDQAISVDFNLHGNNFISGGMDHSIQVWDLTKPELKRIIERSKEFGAGSGGLIFPTYRVQAADFQTRDIHANYIDCVQWFGDLILSKSSGDPSAIVCWQPNYSKDVNQLIPNSAHILHEFNAVNCDYWYMRFGLNYARTMMAIGTIDGKVYLWNLDNPDPQSITRITLSHRLSKRVMRLPAFSLNGNILICGDDDGVIWRWDRNE